MTTLGRMRRSWDWRAPREIAAALRELDTGILHVPLYSRASPYLRLAAKQAGVPLIIAHEWSRPEPPRLVRRLADRLLRPGTRFVAASEAQRRELLATGVHARDIEVVRAGVECERFVGGDRAGTRAALRIGERETLILVPARLHPAKGHLDLIAAMPAIVHAAKGAQVLFAGEGPFRGELEAAVRRAGLAGRIGLLGHRDDVPDLLAAADIIALPSHVEGLPSAILEAYAAERAVVATDVGGVRELLRDGDEGRLVPAREPAMLARALIELANRPQLRLEMGLRASARVRREFHVAAATRRLEATYERWMGEAGLAGAA